MICQACLKEIGQQIAIRADGVCVGCGRHCPEAEVPGQRELQSLVADARLRGAVVRVRYWASGIADQVLVRRIPGAPSEWMNVALATETLKKFIVSKGSESMAQYRDGNEAKAGDLVIGRTHRTTHDVIGILHSIGDYGTCNCRVQQLLGIITADGHRSFVQLSRSDVAATRDLRKIV